MKILIILFLVPAMLFACKPPASNPNPEYNYWIAGEPHAVKLIPPKKKKVKHNPVPARYKPTKDVSANTIAADTLPWILRQSTMCDPIQVWEHPFPFAMLDTCGVESMQYFIQEDNKILFHAILINDTLRIQSSLFDSTAKKAKVIIVADKLFKLK